jgi:DNA uptake protein ComE-like DNA-binding protein
MDRVLQFCLHPERVEAERLNPNTLTPAQIQHLPGLSPARWGIVAESRPFVSFDELPSQGSAFEISNTLATAPP